MKGIKEIFAQNKLQIQYLVLEPDFRNNLEVIC